MRVRKNQLGPMQPIARGGVGQVYRLSAPQLPGLNQPLAYKEILSDLPDPVRADAVHSMEQAVALREAMSPADRAELDRITTWPLATVEEGGSTVGIVMPLIPDDFFVTVNRQGQPPDRKVFAFAYLCASDSYMARMGIDRTGFDALVRLSLAAQLVYAVGLLHKHRIVYGDLSLANVAVAVNPSPPRLLLLDCDAAAALSDPSRRQMHSPFFRPPENQSGAQAHQDLVTDVYKLGLCILRGLVTGDGVTQLTNPDKLVGTLDREGVDLVRRALAPDRTRRPTAKEVCGYLERTVIARARPPVIEGVGLSRSAMVRGGDVVVTWTVASGATRLRILGPNGFAVPVADPGAVPNGYTITPPVSGDIYVEAANRHGTVVAHAGFVDLYELPQLRLEQTRLPRPRVPALAPVQVPTVLSALPARPMVTVDTHPLPRLAAPDLGPLLRTLHSELTGDPLGLLAGAGAATREAFAAAHRAANDRTGAVIGDALESAMRSVTSAVEDSTSDLRRLLAAARSAAAVGGP
jgi:hypothetical protein